MSPSGTAGRRAFTLVEIMIALAIFAAVMLAIYLSWSSILRGKTVGTAGILSNRRSRIYCCALQPQLVCGLLIAPRGHDPLTNGPQLRHAAE